ncbi:MAG TPA: hypothetical protein VNS49_17015, partial [Streptomyces sp.]|nr:hypothetical protein [Streptomyces sp.]
MRTAGNAATAVSAEALEPPGPPGPRTQQVTRAACPKGHDELGEGYAVAAGAERSGTCPPVFFGQDATDV